MHNVNFTALRSFPLLTHESLVRLSLSVANALNQTERGKILYNQDCSNNVRLGLARPINAHHIQLGVYGHFSGGTMYV
jgi:hypothetical protein